MSARLQEAEDRLYADRTSPTSATAAAAAGQQQPQTHIDHLPNNNSFASDPNIFSSELLVADRGGGYEWLGLSSAQPAAAARSCAVDRRDLGNLTTDEFRRHYLDRNVPLLLGDAADILGDTALPAILRLDNLLRDFGHRRVTVSPLPYGSLFGANAIEKTLEEYVHGRGLFGLRRRTQQLKAFLASSSCVSGSGESLSLSLPCAYDLLIDNSSDRHALAKAIFDTDPYYLFGEQLPSEGGVWTKWLDDCPPLLALVRAASASPSAPWRMQLFLGPPLSGAPPHSHGPAFNVLVFGRKQWHLSPPAEDSYSRESPLRGSLRPAGCSLMQRAGEVLFVPRHWTHQVLNLEESAGLAVEIDSYYV